MQFLKQSTAFTFRLGPFVDSTDGDTEENALTIAATAVLLSKAGGALGAKNDATALTGTGANAHYTCVLDATDTNTLGTLRVWSHISGALAVFMDFMVLPAMIYDSLVAGSDRLDTNVTHIGDTAQTANDNGLDINTLITQIGTAGAGLTTIPWNAAWDAEVQSEVQDAIEVNDLDHLIQVDAGVEEPTDGSYLDQVMHKSIGQTFDSTTDSLEAIRDTAPLGTAMRGTDSAALASVCTEGRLAELDAGNLPTDISTVDTVVDAIKVITDQINFTGTYVNSQVKGQDNIDFGALQKASINVEALDVVNVDTLAEMAQGAPPASPTMRQILNYLYRRFRNKTETTATLCSLYDDAGTTVLCKKSTLADDATTFSMAEWITGA